MNALATAIYNLSQTTSNFKTAIGGRFYFEKAPQGATKPFVVCNMINGSHDYYLTPSVSSNNFEEFVIQLNIVSSSSSAVEAGTILGYMKSLFDNASLSISGYTSFPLLRTNVIGPEWFEEDLVYLYYVDYTISLQSS